MPEIKLKVDNPKIESEAAAGFLGGLNTFQDQSLIRDSELTEAKNIILSIDGVEPRHGTDQVYDDGGDTRIYGATGYYQSDGTHEFLRISGQRLKKLSSSTWSAIGSTTFANEITDILQARDSVYFFNGSDNLRKYDGSTVTTYTALSTPTNLAVTATGSTGSTDYAYRVSAFNDQGETLACSSVAISDGNATLSDTNYNALSWDAVTNAVGYNIWGRKATGIGHTYMETVYTNSYNDTGADTPDITTFPPEGNDSGGVKAKYACFAISRIFVAGDPDNPSRLYWGGVGDQLDNFSFAPEGGGAVDIFKNDGSEIRAIVPFQGGVIVGKDTGIFKFSFTDAGYPQIEEITRSFGMISHYATKAVENDLIFPAQKDGRLAFYSLGNQENYAATVLRTNELSIKVASELENVNLAYLDEAPGFYYRNVYGCAIPKEDSTTNDRIWVLDIRFGAWVYWEDMSPSVFTTYRDTDGSENLYYGHNTDGYMWEMWQDDKNDNGSAISVAFATKAFNQKDFRRYKRYIHPTFQFKDITRAGDISGEVVIDGAIVDTEFTISNLSTAGLGVGAVPVSYTLVGDATGGSPAEGETSDKPIVLYKRVDARSIKYNFSSETADLDYKFLTCAHDYMFLPGKRLPSSSRVY